MAVATHLVDTSVVNRLHNADVEAVLVPMLERGLAATCGLLNIEALYSARSPAEYAAESSYRHSVMEYVDTDEADLVRAQEVQARLAARSAHRAAKLPDLIIAAVAERHRLVVLHYDSDFDLIAAVTGQPVQWVVPRGSVP